MARSNAPVGTVKTQRNRKVSCAADGPGGCGLAVYMSRTALLRAGVWPCPGCGEGRMVPVDGDDAALVLDAAALDEHPAVVEYRVALGSAMHGQAGPARALRNLGKSYSADAVALANVERERRLRARERQMGGLRHGRVAADAVVVEPMPF